MTTVPTFPTPPPLPPPAVSLSETDKKWLEARLKAYALWGGKHTDQIEATTDNDVDAILADDFAALAGDLEAAGTGLSAKLDALTAALTEHASTSEADAAGIAAQLATITQGQADQTAALLKLAAAVEALTPPKA